MMITRIAKKGRMAKRVLLISRMRGRVAFQRRRYVAVRKYRSSSASVNAHSISGELEAWIETAQQTILAKSR